MDDLNKTKGKVSSSIWKTIIVIILSIILIMIIICAGLYYYYRIMSKHYLKYELVYKADTSVTEFYPHPGANKYYFFINSHSDYSFYDGREELSNVLPNYDLDKLKTNKYTYLVTVGHEVREVYWDGHYDHDITNLNIVPMCFVANVIFYDYEYNDNTIRIYRLNTNKYFEAPIYDEYSDDIQLLDYK